MNHYYKVSDRVVGVIVLPTPKMAKVIEGFVAKKVNDPWLYTMQVLFNKEGMRGVISEGKPLINRYPTTVDPVCFVDVKMLANIPNPTGAGAKPQVAQFYDQDMYSHLVRFRGKTSNSGQTTNEKKIAMILAKWDEVREDFITKVDISKRLKDIEPLALGMAEDIVW